MWCFVRYIRVEAQTAWREGVPDASRRVLCLRRLSYHFRTFMAKGSQLTQLKSALSQAGAARQDNNNTKKRKRSQPSAKLQEIHDRLNPFDVKVTKLKHDAGGRKIRGATGRPAQSKQAGIEQVLIVFNL
jgi:hypothetical protein